jgi:hypothetical protein
MLLVLLVLVDERWPVRYPPYMSTAAKVGLGPQSCCFVQLYSGPVCM